MSIFSIPVNPIKQLSKLTGADKAAKGAVNASRIQQDYTQQAIDTNQAALEQFKQILQPYLNAGMQPLQSLSQQANVAAPALKQIQGIAGLQGRQTQQDFYDYFADSPYLKTQRQQIENAILQNASATGGLRGGNTQEMLAEVAPKLINDYEQRYYDRLGGLVDYGTGLDKFLAGIGQNAAFNTGEAELNTARNIGAYLTDIGAQKAGAELATSGVKRQTMMEDLPNLLSTFTDAISAFKGI